MKIRHALAKALKTARKSRGLTQEDFSSVSSRTYVSILERGQKSPTIDKVQALSQAIGIHCLSLLTLAFLYSEDEDDIDLILDRVRVEIENVTRDG